MIEKHLREGLFLSQGNIAFFFSSPIAATMWIFVFIVMIMGFLRSRGAKKTAVGSDQ
jgi:TctA family transporter